MCSQKEHEVTTTKWMSLLKFLNAILHSFSGSSKLICFHWIGRNLRDVYLKHSACLGWMRKVWIDPLKDLLLKSLPALRFQPMTDLAEDLTNYNQPYLSWLLVGSLSSPALDTNSRRCIVTLFHRLCVPLNHSSCSTTTVIVNLNDRFTAAAAAAGWHNKRRPCMCIWVFI